MRARIIELEEELAQYRPAKRAKVTASTAVTPQAGPSTNAPSAATLKAEEKKRKAQLKKIFDRYVTRRLF
jgi:hypothetical protein